MRGAENHCQVCHQPNAKKKAIKQWNGTSGFVDGYISGPESDVEKPAVKTPDAPNATPEECPKKKAKATAKAKAMAKATAKAKAMAKATAKALAKASAKSMPKAKAKCLAKAKAKSLAKAKAAKAKDLGKGSGDAKKKGLKKKKDNVALQNSGCFLFGLKVFTPNMLEIEVNNEVHNDCRGLDVQCLPASCTSLFAWLSSFGINVFLVKMF